MNKIDHAKELAKLGLHVFPLIPNTKLPLIEDFPNRASYNLEQIEKWWKDTPDANIGISTSKFNGTGALVAVDVDNKNGVSGDDTLFGLEIEGKLLPTTFTQHTPTGGKHLLYYYSRPVKQGAGVLGKGLDIRSRGGYIVGAGSTIGGVPYTYVYAPFLEIPKWVVDECGEAKPKTTRAPAVNGVDQKHAITRAKHYITQEAPAAVEGNRNHTAFLVAAKVKDFGVAEDECFDLLSTYWDCSPPLDQDELADVVASAYKNSDNPPGILAPEAHFSSVDEISETKLYLDEINKEYALLYEDGGHVVMRETTDSHGNEKLVMYPEATFNRKFSTKTVQESDGKKITEVSHSKKWLNWTGRREYDGLCFSPGKAPPKGYYNLWRGFKVEPLAYEDADMFQRAGFDAFMGHARDNVCKGDGPLFQWLMGYFAQMIQKPYERPLTTLVFQGKKGTGKNTLVDRIGYLLRDHYKVAADSRYLTSNFNGHLDNCLMLVLDEAFWSGDKSAEGKLKGLTTSPRIMIERKGKEPYMVDNFARLVVIGNEEWLVPASADERRYAVFQVGEGKMQDTRYFSEMVANMDVNGGSRVLLDYLQKFDLSKIDVNVAPQTEGLNQQKLEALSPLEGWWFDCLTRGRVSGEEWESVIDKNLVFEAFVQYCRSRSVGGWRFDNRRIGKELRKFHPSVNTDWKLRAGGSFPPAYKFSDLETARAEWAEYLGFEIDWSKQ